ncbi:uncharacterized protein MONOS_4123 [Monocercomonoides exilis]|uniref:uncharacterized protein n=1 Tax=Monocercomonoides exilis TaxID=2049356 RepID=UPI00355961E2|nr:hypothetical protein MONOS_4123 [Monocercomonoides exilis]|eukprot:MONOS_4123.1-p1 / transcript=MONOS_4123.1 / gene=MONOS_4123 / organism=Monocercomonoides_exilis_PA203 / gene_product=unspecified product / transcript_product=unspecified product / location=Mono_scaffold00105:91066-91435(+) / protein_length=101 / sequence_SO=supercontig / SO=protein_coding / is_pseudo=false
MKNQAEMFMSLSQELKEIKEKLAEKGETEVVDLIEQIQDGEKRRLPMMTKLHELIINDLDAHKNNEEINRLTKEMGEVGEEINDAISELKLLINAKTMEKK